MYKSPEAVVLSSLFRWRTRQSIWRPTLGGDIEHLGGFVATGGDELAVSGKSHTANN